MATHGHRRQVLLFLVAIILPCIVLVALGARMLVQERELHENRLADERRMVASRLSRELSTRLDRIALDEATAIRAGDERWASRPDHPAVRLVAKVIDGQLSLPWEQDVRTARFRRVLGEEAFALRVSRAERAELVSGQPTEAVGLYGEALAAARDPVQATYARLLRARASLAAGDRTSALRDFRFVLASSLDAVDDHGVPLALYAASRLRELNLEQENVLVRVRDVIEGPQWLSPTALYLARDLVDRAGSRLDSVGSADADPAGLDALAAEVVTRIALVEQVIALRRDFAQLGLMVGGARVHAVETPWVLYGTPSWLVGRMALLEGEGDVVVAVCADSLFEVAEQAVLQSTGIAAALAVRATDAFGEAEGEPLGATFPGVVARFPSLVDGADPGWEVRRWFYLVALMLVVSVTLFGAYLVSRDVRRELRVAELRSRFVSAVSHELKTPLTAIRMFAETLLLGRSASPQTQTEYLETIVNESERLTRLLNNVLDFSKIERGKKEYRRGPNDLAEIVQTSARAMQYPLEQQQFTLNVDLQDGIPPANVDRDAIEQAILNLLANAMKYSGTSKEIDLRLRREDGRAAIGVTDYGIGIDPDEQRRIFEQFYRVSTTDNEGIPGTGLGLTLVRHIAEGHDGQVTVQSKPGEGSTFTIHLPLGDERS